MSGSNLSHVQRHCWSGSQPKSQILGYSQKQTKLHEPQSHQQGTCRWSRLSLTIFLPGSPLPQSSATAQRHSAERSAGPGLHAPSARAAAGWGRRVLLPDLCPEQPLSARRPARLRCGIEVLRKPALHRLTCWFPEAPQAPFQPGLSSESSVRAPQILAEPSLRARRPTRVWKTKPERLCALHPDTTPGAPARLRAACPHAAALPRSGAGRAVGSGYISPSVLVGTCRTGAPGL